MDKRTGTKFNEADPDMIIVSMIEFRDKIYVATQKGIYIIKDDQLIRLKFGPKQ